MSPRRTMLGLHARLVRRSTLILGLLFFAGTASVTAGYDGLYPPGTDRTAAVELGENPGIRALIGSGAGLDTAGGFAAWRFGGPAVVILAVWAYLATTRLLRGEEDAGRAELLGAGALTKSDILRSATAVVGVASAVIAACSGLGMVVTGVPAGGALLTAAAISTGGLVFGALGVVAAQLLPTRRAAALTCGAFAVAAFLVRAIANAREGLEWVRWATPFGWSELVRPFGERTALPFVVAAATVGVLASLGGRLARRRDLGSAVVPDAGRRDPRPFGLASTLGLASRQGLPRAGLWLVPVVILSSVFGLLCRDVGEFFETSETFMDVVTRFGLDASVPIRAFLGFVVSMLTVVTVSFAVAEVGAVREDEAAGRLDNLLTRAVGRRTWLGGRLAVVVVGVVILSLGLASGAAAGASAAGAGVPAAEFVTVGVNAVPIALFFLGVSLLVFAAAPRATTGLGFGLVGIAFTWQILGSAIQAPQWTMDLSPFSHVAPVPAQGMNVGAAVSLTVIGVVAAIAATERFARRDIQEA